MAALDATARAAIKSLFVQEFFAQMRQTADLDDTEVATLINDLDTWLDANLTAANSAITASVRTKASSNTKFAALAWVAMKRAGAK